MMRTLFFIPALFFAFSCQNTPPPEPNPDPTIIPLPQSISPKTGQFFLDGETKIVLPSEELEWQWVANHIAEKIKPATGFPLTIAEKVASNKITFEKTTAIAEKEGYELVIDPYEIIIRSSTAQGAFHAVQSLLQLLPTTVFSKQKIAQKKWAIPCIKIKDAPRFSYRGMHLDVCRHFFPPAFVKKYIDMLAFHKMNYFHWHLTEDQGWRIEIKKYPKLTEVGAFRNGTLIGHYNDEPHQFDEKRYGGFYTQEEIKDIVAYAKERFITIVPEIEMPGHAQAALAAYPELGCTPGPFEVWQKWGVSENVFCPTEKTFQFLEEVLEEVIALFPGKYIHIGGDECPKVRWEESAFCQDLIKKEKLKDEHGLQSYFIQRMEKFINKKGKQIIGWDEILEGGLAPNATVMSWRGYEGGIEAAKEKHEVIMTPTSHCYFDYYQSQHPDEPLAIGGFLPLEMVYAFEPVPAELDAAAAKYIIGAQGNVWTEYMKTTDKVMYMTFPRMCALAEKIWTDSKQCDYKDFTKRISSHFERLENMDIKVAKHIFDLKTDFYNENNGVKCKLSTDAGNAKIYYTVDGTEPSTNSTLYQGAIPIAASCTLKAVPFQDNVKSGKGIEQYIHKHKAAGKLITLKDNPHKKYSAGGTTAIVNGVKGSDERYGDKEWLGFEGKDFEAVIDLGESQKIDQVKMRFFKGEGQWIYLPKKIEVYSSENNNDFTLVGTQSKIESNKKVIEVPVSVKDGMGRFLKIKVNRFGLIPDGAQGAGHEAWLFVDEIVVE